MINKQITETIEPQAQQSSLLLPTECAIALRWHPESVRRAIRAKRIHAVKTGRQWKIPAAELQRILREGV